MSFPLTSDVLTRHRTRHKLAPVSFRFTTLSRGFFLQTLPTSVCLILCLGSVYISRNVPKRVPDSNFSYWNKLERNSHSYSGARNSKRPQDVKCCLWPYSVPGRYEHVQGKFMFYCYFWLLKYSKRLLHALRYIFISPNLIDISWAAPLVMHQ